jgi:hypothetical protein
MLAFSSCYFQLVLDAAMIDLITLQIIGHLGNIKNQVDYDMPVYNRH